MWEPRSLGWSSCLRRPQDPRSQVNQTRWNVWRSRRSSRASPSLLPWPMLRQMPMKTMMCLSVLPAQQYLPAKVGEASRVLPATLGMRVSRGPGMDEAVGRGISGRILKGRNKGGIINETSRPHPETQNPACFPSPRVSRVLSISTQRVRGEKYTRAALQSKRMLPTTSW
jgi:hypothetical protein